MLRSLVWAAGRVLAVLTALAVPWIGGGGYDPRVTLRGIRIAGAILWGMALVCAVALGIPWLGTTWYGHKSNRLYESMFSSPPWPLFTGLATLPALVLIWIWRTSHKDDELRLSQETHITNRFVAALQLLPDTNGDDAQIGAIYALERLARDSAADREAVRKTLTAFVMARLTLGKAGVMPRASRVVEAAMEVLQGSLFLGPSVDKLKSDADVVAMAANARSMSRFLANWPTFWPMRPPAPRSCW